MKDRRCVIVSGGDFSPVDGLGADDFVIACDRGYVYCERLGIRPDLVISDFDSYSGPVAPSVPLNTYASEKDDTDTMLAVRYAVEHGFESLLLCCALGGRLDHLIANLQSLVFAQRHGVRAVLRSEDTEMITLEDGSLHVPRREGWSLSVFAMDGPCRGVSIAGAKYPLRDAELLPSFPLGVSNQWTEAEAEICVREGLLLIVLSRMPEAGTENS
ncbi:MAG: thiamine diphosphokinase [Oscillospiraceae bacterium]|nr:thiamine diphosphokinase [Oscillospiraceae bacterium]